MTLFSKKFIIPTLVITFLYIVVITYSMNVRILKDTLFGDYNVVYKLKLLYSLLQGMWTAMSGSGLVMLFLIALLTGANLTLLFSKMSLLKNSKRLRLVVGGNSLFGIIGSGCAACGLPILSLLGLGGSVMYLPYHGAELSYLSFILLATSLYLLLKNNDRTCAISYEKNK
jgi:hypothetical protein